MQLNNLKLATRNETDLTLRLSSKMSSNSNDEANFPHKLLITDRQILSRRAFANNLSTDIKLSDTQISKIIQLGRFLGRSLWVLIKVGLPLMKNVFTR